MAAGRSPPRSPPAAAPRGSRKKSPAKTNSADTSSKTSHTGDPKLSSSRRIEGAERSLDTPGRGHAPDGDAGRVGDLGDAEKNPPSPPIPTLGLPRWGSDDAPRETEDAFDAAARVARAAAQHPDVGKYAYLQPAAASHPTHAWDLSPIIESPASRKLSSQSPDSKEQSPDSKEQSPHNKKQSPEGRGEQSPEGRARGEQRVEEVEKNTTPVDFGGRTLVVKNTTPVDFDPFVVDHAEDPLDNLPLVAEEEENPASPTPFRDPPPPRTESAMPDSQEGPRPSTSSEVRIRDPPTTASSRSTDNRFHIHRQPSTTSTSGGDRPPTTATLLFEEVEDHRSLVPVADVPPSISTRAGVVPPSPTAVDRLRATVERSRSTSRSSSSCSGGAVEPPRRVEPPRPAGSVEDRARVQPPRPAGFLAHRALLDPPHLSEEDEEVVGVEAPKVQPVEPPGAERSGLADEAWTLPKPPGVERPESRTKALRTGRGGSRVTPHGDDVRGTSAGAGTSPEEPPTE